MERRGFEKGIRNKSTNRDKGRLPPVVERASSVYTGHGGNGNGTARQREG
jgi:hypothetical protein